MKKTNYVLYFISCVIVIFIIEGLFIWKLYLNTQNQIGNNAIMLSKAVANAVDIGEYEKISKTKIKNEYYYKMQKYFHKTALDSKVKYLYVSKYVSDKEIEYIFDSSGDTLGSKDDNVHPYIYKTKASTFEKLTHYNQWGTLITGNTPLINNKGEIVGLVGVDIDASNFNSLLFSREKISYVFSLAMMILVIITLSLFLRLDYLHKIDLIKLYKKSFDMLSASLSKKSDYTSSHSKKVSQFAEILAKKMGFRDKEILIISWAGLLHDIGKIGIRDEILNKPSTLTIDEYAEIKNHPNYSKEILSKIFRGSNPFLGPKDYKIIMDIVSYHHERWDGKGYPHHLKGDEIPLTARIVSLADSLEAMLAERPYKKPLDEEEILQEIRDNSGRQFDPQVVEAFIKCYEAGDLKLSYADENYNQEITAN